MNNLCVHWVIPPPSLPKAKTRKLFALFQHFGITHNIEHNVKFSPLYRPAPIAYIIFHNRKTICLYPYRFIKYIMRAGGGSDRARNVGGYNMPLAHGQEKCN